VFTRGRAQQPLKNSQKPTNLTIDTKHAQEFTRKLHSTLAGLGNGVVAWITKCTGGRPWTRYAPPGNLPAGLDARGDVLVSVCTFNGTRNARSALAAPACWVDLDPPSDLANLDTWRDEAFARLVGADPGPSLVVSSGRGWHGYWLLDPPAGLDWLGRVVMVNRVLAAALGGDTVHDLARVMRLPGSRTPKPGAGPCRVVESWPRRYNLADLELALDVEVAKPTKTPFRTARISVDPNPFGADPPIRERSRGRPALGVTVRDLRSLSRWARELVVGGPWRSGNRYRVNGGVDRSRADLAAVGAMISASWTPAKIRAAFSREDWLVGARYRQLAIEDGLRRADAYLARTIRKATHE